MKKETKVVCIECPKCKDVIYSRAIHDFRKCSCGDSFIDGGFEYVRIGSNHLHKIKTFNKYIEATKKELFNDWSKGKDKYGRI